MHLMRIGPAGFERPVVRIDQDTYIDVSDLVEDYNETFFAAGGPRLLNHTVADRLADGAVHRFAGERIGAPISRPHQILGVGANYRTPGVGASVPTDPLVFSKAPNSLCGPYDPVLMPRNSAHTDWEVELGAVIGTRSHYLADDAAATAAIAGYVLVNDITERAFQKERGGQWLKGKSAPTFNPCGPWLATPDAVGDTAQLRLWLEHNGTRRQDGTTADMLFSVARIIRHLSQFMVLEPGDLINTGTLFGAGKDLDPPCYLSPGDTLTCGADGLGRQHQVVMAAP
ncbi:MULTISPECIES: fumarylacetoacetate hydrolase family protein [Streptomyces]|uniref:fumarylacetoacetate hydrolase family protein n=1 Tax=Streptomyces TaxID=1883 RepID=UPI00101E83A5|nr:fumarylacetoacetate hydrolase family protein [Streptomyces albidoflavus]RZF01098.1 ureidoglycolate lyase [Streptomyces albidoflavus]RZF02969.1 ureidoglycolate lyase [Streptomyces albidoflavus]